VTPPSPDDLHGRDKPCDDVQKCQLGLFCDGGVCHPKVSSGPCSTAWACTPGHYCSGLVYDTPGECVPYLAFGADCSAHPDTCIDGACNADGKCANAPTTGQSCKATASSRNGRGPVSPTQDPEQVHHRALPSRQAGAAAGPLAQGLDLLLVGPEERHHVLGHAPQVAGLELAPL
jgi:hypothetical protein